MPVPSIMQLLHAFFSARGNIVRIDSCTDDSIRISLTVAIRLIGAPVNRYTPRRRSKPTMAQVMSFCAEATIFFNGFQNYPLKITATCPHLPGINKLTHWGRVTHICICVSKLTIIGSDKTLSPGRHQAIIWTNDGTLLIGHLRIKTSVKF